MKNRFLIVLLLLFVTMQLLSCDSADKKDTPQEVNTEEKTKITNIYEPVECCLPDGYSYEESVTPFYDEYTGNLTVIGSITEEETDNDGNIQTFSGYKLFTFGTDGMLCGSVDVSSDSSARIIAGTINKEDFLSIERGPAESVLVKRDCSSGEIIHETAFSEIFGAGADYNFSFLAEDGEGDIWLGNENMAVLLGSDFQPKENFYFTDSVSSLACGSDGKVYGCLSEKGCKYFVELDKTSGGIKKLAPIDMAAQKISFAKHIGKDDVGYDFYYNTSDGIYGVMLNEDGSVNEEIILDYANSGIRNNAELKLMGIAADGTEFNAA